MTSPSPACGTETVRTSASPSVVHTSARPARRLVFSASATWSSSSAAGIGGPSREVKRSSAAPGCDRRGARSI